MKTAVVILNWNTRTFLEKFLPALIESIEGQDAELVVADNASTDGSVELLQSRFKASVRTMVFDKNYGFTGGYNRALSQIEAQYYVLINSDVEVPEGWLQPLIRHLEENPGCAACGPKIHSWAERDMFEYAGAAGGYIDFFGYPFCRGRVLGRVEKDFGQYDSPAKVMWVSGACLAVRSDVWHRLGGLDERFFAHMEEIDYCWRAQLQGYSIDVVPESVVYHVGGGTLANDSPFKLKLNYRNNLLMLGNNLRSTIGRRRAALRIFMRMCLDLLSALVYLLRGRGSYFMAVMKAHREFLQLRSGREWRIRPVSTINGFWRGFILPAAFIYGDRVFEYIRKRRI